MVFNLKSQELLVINVALELAKGLLLSPRTPAAREEQV
jgi:hypothetical protein